MGLAGAALEATMTPRERQAVRERLRGHPALRSWAEKERDAAVQAQADREMVRLANGGFGDCRERNADGVRCHRFPGHAGEHIFRDLTSGEMKMEYMDQFHGWLFTEVRVPG